MLRLLQDLIPIILDLGKMSKVLNGLIFLLYPSKEQQTSIYQMIYKDGYLTLSHDN